MREGALAKYTKKTLMYLFLILASLLSIFPLYWSFISAFNNTQQILGGRMIPSVYLVQNIQNLFGQQDVFTALKNSFATSICRPSWRWPSARSRATALRSTTTRPRTA